MAVVIALVGEAGSGKDSIADVLCEKFDFERHAFAEPLKKSCQEIFGFTDEQLHDRNKKEEVDEEWSRSPREMFQQVGTLLREIDEDVWLKIMQKKLKKAQEKNKDVVVTDCRYENEARFLRSEHDAILVRVVRPQNEAATSHNQHTSETQQLEIDCDFTVVNDGTLKDLKEKTTAFLLEIVDKKL